MATRKTTVNTEAEEALKAAEAENAEAEKAEAAEAPYDPWTDMVSVRIPRNPAGEDYQVSVNNIGRQIPAKGGTYELPRPLAEVLMASLEQEDMVADSIDAMKAYDPTTNPHK